jgi:hypothetical protein
LSENIVDEKEEHMQRSEEEEEERADKRFLGVATYLPNTECIL